MELTFPACWIIVSYAGILLQSSRLCEHFGSEFRFRLSLMSPVFQAHPAIPRLGGSASLEIAPS